MADEHYETVKSPPKLAPNLHRFIAAYEKDPELVETTLMAAVGIVEDPEMNIGKGRHGVTRRSSYHLDDETMFGRR